MWEIEKTLFYPSPLVIDKYRVFDVVESEDTKFYCITKNPTKIKNNPHMYII